MKISKVKAHNKSNAGSRLSCQSSGNDSAMTPPVNRVAKNDGLLARVLATKNKTIIHRLITKNGLSIEVAEDLWQDALRFLFLAGTVQETITPTLRLDAVWHEFILDTRAYREFCQHLGHFIDHVPNDPDLPPGDGSLIKRTRELARARFGVLSKNWDTARRSAPSPEGCVGAEDRLRHTIAPTAGACLSNCEN